MANNSVKQGYNRAAEEYNAKRNQFENNKYLEQLNSLLKPHSQILDIGCGGGLPVDKYLISEGHKITGIDISEKMIELARRNVPEGDYGVEDMSELQLGEYHMDAIVSFYAIFHIPRESHQTLLNIINSFLPKGGLLLITMGANGEDNGSWQEFHGEKVFYSFFQSEKNTNLVKMAGFEVLLDEIDRTNNEKHQVILARKY